MPAVYVDEGDAAGGAHNGLLELHGGGLGHRRRGPAVGRPADLALFVIHAGQVMAVAQYLRAAELERRGLREVQREDPVESMLVPHVGLVEERILRSGAPVSGSW